MLKKLSKKRQKEKAENLLQRIVEALNKRIKDKKYKPELNIPWAQF